MKRFLLFICFAVAGFGGAQAQDGGTKSESVVTILGESFYVHNVQSGETIYGLTRLYNVTEEELTTANPQLLGGLQAGQVLKIPVRGEVNRRGEEIQLNARQIRRTFTTHTVNQAETVTSIAKRYNIAVNTLIEDNKGLDPNRISIGQTLYIRRDGMGETSAAEIDRQMGNYAEALSSLSDNFDHYLVAQGETLYSLSRQYNVPVDVIQRYNTEELKDGLKAGSIIRIPVEKSAMQTPQQQDRQDDRRLFPGTAQQPGEPEWEGETSLKNIDIQATLKVVAMLPLRVNGANNASYLQFYQGVLMALGELKRVGMEVKLDLYNTARSESEVRSLLRNREVEEADLIIGPIYDETFSVVADFARRRGIPVVSPLAPVGNEGNPLVYQVYQPEETKNDKLRGELAGDRNVIVVSASGDNDTAFEREVSALAPNPTHRINYTTGVAFAGQVEKLLSRDKENVFIVLAGNGNSVNGILSAISSVKNNIVATSRSNPQVKVIGTSRWADYTAIDKNLLFKLNTMYVVRYHADRTNERVFNFDKKYIVSFSAFPTSYSYRGYDVTKLFVANLKLYGDRFPAYINDGAVLLLESPYRFEQTGRNGKYVNNEWTLVHYKSDYSIEVK